MKSGNGDSEVDWINQFSLILFAIFWFEAQSPSGRALWQIVE